MASLIRGLLEMKDDGCLSSQHIRTYQYQDSSQANLHNALNCVDLNSKISVLPSEVQTMTRHLT